jgi:hypothetical protein
MYRSLEAWGDPQPHPSGALSNTSQRFRYSRGLPAGALAWLPLPKLLPEHP